ncbi:MAG TPA: alpha/beta fold hydrolase [Blastocatellia bacterium]
MKLSVTHRRPRKPTEQVAVFLHGFGSDQTGEKAVFLGERLTKEGFAFVTFDFRGHGKSEGAMKDLTVSRMLEDCAEVIAPLSEEYNRVALIGSSMGGCVGAWYAAINRDQIASCALIAPAFSFVNLIVDEIGQNRLRQWKKDGLIEFTNQYGTVELGYDLVEDWRLYPLSQLAERFSTPALIIHGMRDEAISYLHTLSFASRAASKEIDVILVKDGDHRLTAHKEKLGDWIASHLAHAGR